MAPKSSELPPRNSEPGTVSPPCPPLSNPLTQRGQPGPKHLQRGCCAGWGIVRTWTSRPQDFNSDGATLTVEPCSEEQQQQFLGSRPAVGVQSRARLCCTDRLPPLSFPWTCPHVWGVPSPTPQQNGAQGEEETQTNRAHEPSDGTSAQALSEGGGSGDSDDAV